MKAPTPQQLREFLARHKLPTGQAARLVGVSRSRFRLFMIDETSAGHMPCPFSVWYTLTDRVAKGEHLEKS